jgi:hypothetical protein
VVGVGSVGTLSWIAVLVGRDNDDTLILQVKEAEASVLARFVAKSPFTNHGQRVVEGQRLMQAASDIFLGWQRLSAEEDERPHDYYVRQLWDWKLSANVATMAPDAWESTPRCAAGLWPLVTPGREMLWRSVLIWAAVTLLRWPWRTLPAPTPTRTTGTTKRYGKLSPPAR